MIFYSGIHSSVLLHPRFVFTIIVSLALKGLGGGFNVSPGAAGVEGDFVEIDLLHCGVPYFNFVVHIII